MKKLIYLFFLLPLMLNLAACYDDQGNYDYTDLPDVAIKMQDTLYVTQFKTLELTAEVDLDGVPESDYEFSWRIWSNDVAGTWAQKEIGNGKHLTHEVLETPGSYTLLLTATDKKTEVKTYKQIYLTVQGAITEGWMVLQEKEGKTDFDLIMSPYFSNRVENDEILHNVYETANGEPLDGRGVVIRAYFNIGRYQDVIVFTDKGGARLSAITMQKTFDVSTLVRDLSSWKPESYIFWHYYYSPGRLGYEAVVSNGRFYIYNSIGAYGFTTYTEPILENGMTYKASPYAPTWFDYYSGILYDEIGGRFLGVEQNTWILRELATPEEQFDLGNMHASLRYMEHGYRNLEYGLFEDWDTKEMTLCAFNFDVKTNIARGKYSADNCPELKDAKYFAVGALGPVFLYATDRDIYRYDYEGTNAGEKLYTLAKADEKITGMKIFKPCIDRFITSHPYNNKVLILSTYNESKKEGKIYMYYINEVNGMIDVTSEKVFEGFGEILDMAYNYPKYGA